MEKTVKVRVVKRYNDLALKKIQEVGAEFETNSQRAKYLVSQGMVEIIGKAKSERKENRTDEEKKNV